MERFILFTARRYYPSGGWGDFHSSSNDFEELKRRAVEVQREENLIDWHILDTDKWEVVWEVVAEE